jgi:hypothetical protein
MNTVEAEETYITGGITMEQIVISTAISTANPPVRLKKRPGFSRPFL